MQTINDAIRLLRRQADLEAAMGKPGGIRITEGQELIMLRRLLGDDSLNTARLPSRSSLAVPRLEPEKENQITSDISNTTLVTINCGRDIQHPSKFFDQRTSIERLHDEIDHAQLQTREHDVPIAVPGDHDHWDGCEVRL